MNRIAHLAATTAVTLALGLGFSACSATTFTTGSPSAAASATAVTGAGGAQVAFSTHLDASDLTWNAANEVLVALANGASSGGAGVTVSGDTVTITAGGVYRVTGSLSNGQLVVAAPDDQAVVVILDGVTITSGTGPALSVTSADEVTLYLADGTSSTLTDGTGYTVANDATPVAAVASATDLTIAGRGSLTVNGKTNDAISTKDGLVIASGHRGRRRDPGQGLCRHPRRYGHGPGRWRRHLLRQRRGRRPRLGEGLRRRGQAHGRQ